MCQTGGDSPMPAVCSICFEQEREFDHRRGIGSSRPFVVDVSIATGR
jgi:hypothetical protein